jgi:hypothetical protein
MNETKRFWAKVDRQGADGCWLWKGYRGRDGYGRININGTQVVAHRWAYEDAIVPIPAGLQIDHLCRVRACVNPGHLEPVTQRENILRGVGYFAINAQKTHCKHGHEFTESNTYTWHEEGGGAHRACVQCRRTRKQKMQITLKEESE